MTADRDMARRSLEELQQRWTENRPAAEYKARLAEAERDAARYRWLRDVHEHHVFVTRMVGGATIPRYVGHDLDALIDEARAASSATPVLNPPEEGRK